MKTIGLIGGMSWESTLDYYRNINQGIKQVYGGLHSAKIAMVSLDFASIENLQQQGDWHEAGRVLQQAAKEVEAAGADCILICTNTMHKVAEDVSMAVNIPLLHIADATAECIVQDKLTCVGLLGTSFTMEQDFYKQRLIENYGLNVLVPEQADRELVHQVIYQELCLGDINPASQRAYIRIISDLAARGAEAVILGCTEITLLVKQSDCDVPLLDTTAIHAACAVKFAIS
ncbi:aspartate/glutamate racemase family protein [Motilimonas pumila]|uniref:Aspartate/glutamate racemase family protein n=1 Tax=Motilimonas pumila TaxID=2303987 RepID=A0A418YFL9_9GAMM|nr:aspartate/glutamate racemase family protein [Motilimonas pumila]RJG48175.1 aspartate/glutamate racemase family protein [Motilimonas pumila]